MLCCLISIQPKLIKQMSGSMCFTSTLKIEEEEIMVTKKQGIISILGSDDDNNNNNNNNNNNITKKASSLRRTLSADMSSRKWLTQNGFNNSSTLKKTASSLNLIPVSITEEDSPTQSDVWNSIQQEKNEEKTGKFDIWDSIISQKVDQQGESEPALYIHPLVKRSKSSLSEKSLEICTESLGSETGSDGFSSYPASETSDDDEQQQQQQGVDDETTMRINNSVNYYAKKPEKKSFPPPIPSLSLRREGGPAATLRMKSHRNNGRLVLEAVPVPQQNTNFNAQRQGGRLVLTFAGQNNKHDVNANKFEDDDDISDSEIDDDTEEMDDRYVFDEKPKKNNLSGGMINVHRLALMMNKPMALPNRNPTIWSNKFNVDQVKPTTIAQSLPPRPPRLIPSQPPSVAAGAASLNAYEYYWRPEPMGPQSLSKSIYNIDNKKSILSQSGRQILRRNKGGYIVPLSKGCKEPRRPSLVFWEPCCITTS